MEPYPGWNPLLGTPPASTLKALEDLVAAQSPRAAQLQLFDNVPKPKLNRWPFRTNSDGLVHALMSLHNSKFWGYAGASCPVEAITQCGTLALLIAQSTKLGVYNTGAIVPDSHPTCLACASGLDMRGETFRAAQKEASFGRMYGMSGVKTGRMSSSMPNMNVPNMQQMPRNVGKSRPFVSQPKYQLKELMKSYPAIGKYTEAMKALAAEPSTLLIDDRPTGRPWLRKKP